MATPQIPPRPSRTQHQQPLATTSTEAPKVPPRPNHRHVDRSTSPHRVTFARSPLNEITFASNHGNLNSSLYSTSNQNGSSSSLGLQRPPSVSLPSIGQEGNEYADLEYDPSEDAKAVEDISSTQTRNVGSDLPLHAPKPSLSTSSAKARVATVTRTDSSQAAAIGIGKTGTPIQHDERDRPARALQSKTSFTRTESSASTERPSSTIAEDEQGIPEIGQRVPMYPNAGDVQAPSPSPFSQTFQSSIEFPNDGTQKADRHHGRTRSGREVFHGPPGSYGLHGHGVPNQDRFEKAWYDKHPDAMIREGGGQYGAGIAAGRGEWALSSEDLNKIVRDTASRGAGLGTSPNVVGLPNEQIGYMASEEYSSRMNSPRSQSVSYHHKAHSNHSQPHVESPLRKASFPVDIEGKEDFNRHRDSPTSTRARSENALESETEDDDIIHVDAPKVTKSKYSGNGYDPPTDDLGPHGGNTEAEGGWIEETGYGTPILASDEVAKTPGLEYMQPAIAPTQERRGSTYYAGVDSESSLAYQSGHRNGSRAGSVSGSRSSSRPGSIYGSLPNLTRFTSIASHDDREDMHTPLEDVEEYEPLFPDEEGKTERAVTAADRFKGRPDMKRRFPSQDIWEDTPSSLQLQATVSTPEPTEDQASKARAAPSTVFESPETESARKGEVSEEEKAKLILKEERWAKSHFQPHLREDMHRPGMKQRFPSRDIWEDTPDSAQLETTVGESQFDGGPGHPDDGLIAGAVVYTAGRPGQQSREGATAGEPSVEKPSIPPRPGKSKLSEDSNQHESPSIPARPQQKARQIPALEKVSSEDASARSSPKESTQSSPTEARKAPVLPDRPKPHVPARPAKPGTQVSSESIPLSKTTSATSKGSNGDSSADGKSIISPPPAPKHKPALPARQIGSKMASLKAGFMTDLDKRLQLGPQAPPKPQERLPAEEDKEEEKPPLTDARKGRARGPVRRKPAASPATGSADEASKRDASKLTIAEPWTLWQIHADGDGSLDAVHATHKPGKTELEVLSKADESKKPISTSRTAVDPATEPDQVTRPTKRAEHPGISNETPNVIEDVSGQTTATGSKPTEAEEPQTSTTESVTASTIEHTEPAVTEQTSSSSHDSAEGGDAPLQTGGNATGRILEEPIHDKGIERVMSNEEANAVMERNVSEAATGAAAATTAWGEENT